MPDERYGAIMIRRNLSRQGKHQDSHRKTCQTHVNPIEICIDSSNHKAGPSKISYRNDFFNPLMFLQRTLGMESSLKGKDYT